MIDIVVIGHNLRSTHNVGSLLRTAEGLGVQKVIFTGYTPYPEEQNDTRLPHLSAKITRQINKTALGAEQLISWQHQPDINSVINDLKKEGYVIAGLEQNPTAIKLPDYQSAQKIALILGREVEGIEKEVLAQCDVLLEIPMLGKKESFNVVQAAAIALYQLRWK